jgi:23S rRNA (cytidine1920-2'-O)/16S rRNA (cytidine1409-2'-O)-methyltransferase
MSIENTLEHKNRLDVEVALRGLTRSRSSATDFIKRGNVSVNGKIILKPSFEIARTDIIAVTGSPFFVSRAGEKLEYALSKWNIDVRNKIAVDIGSSTGGFTQCLLSRGVKKVYSIDVGTDQLDPTFRNDERVIAMEKTDARDASLPELVDIAVVDLSFISLSHVLPKVFELVRTDGYVVALVKPQFEIGMKKANETKGIVVDETLQKQALASIEVSAQKIGFKVDASIDSPITGEHGNKEFFLLLKR